MPQSPRGFRTANLDRQFHKVGVPCDIAADNTGIGAAEILGPAPQSLAAPVAPAPQPPPPAPLPVPPPSHHDLFHPLFLPHPRKCANCLPLRQGLGLLKQRQP